MEAVKLSEIIGSTSAISPRAGLKAYDFTVSRLSKGDPLQISFQDIEDLTSAFCNAFIGKICMDFAPDIVNSLLYIEGVGHDVWRRKIDSAILLGTNENARKLHEKNLEDVIHS